MALRGTTATIDLAELERLCAMQCTDEEIASWFGVNTRTIERRRKNRVFAEVMDRGKAKGRISVRRMQMKLLEQGNATMGVWLGKQILNQTDEVRHEVNGTLAHLSVILPRAMETAAVLPRGSISLSLIEAGEVEESMEIASTDDETV
jgi:hypothetical protein